MNFLRMVAVALAIVLAPAGASAWGDDPAFQPAALIQDYAGDNSEAIEIAKRYLGTNPTRLARLWCARFMGFIERKMDREGTGSDAARSYAEYAPRVPLSQSRPGDIVVLERGARGGHVGYLIKRRGDRLKLISGNHGGKVGIGWYPARRVIAVVRP